MSSVRDAILSGVLQMVLMILLRDNVRLAFLKNWGMTQWVSLTAKLFPIQYHAKYLILLFWIGIFGAKMAHPFSIGCARRYRKDLLSLS